MTSNSISHQFISNTSHHTINTKHIISITLLHRLSPYNHTSLFTSLPSTTRLIPFPLLTSKCNSRPSPPCSSSPSPPS